MVKLKPCKSNTKTSTRSLLYDEFIVYHEEQINLRYVIKLKITNDDDSN